MQISLILPKISFERGIRVQNPSNINGQSKLQIHEYSSLAPPVLCWYIFYDLLVSLRCSCLPLCLLCVFPFTLTVPPFSLHQTVRCYLVMIHVSPSFFFCFIYFICAFTCWFSVVNDDVLTESTLYEIPLCVHLLYLFLLFLLFIFQNIYHSIN